ncbi:MAG: alanine racemase [Pseudomonadota bacterium]
MQPEPPKPTLRLRVDRQALSDNWRALDRLSGSAQTGAAVKADCYGLGVDTCIPALRDAGAKAFFVAHWSEVAAVSRHVPPDEIAVLHGPLTREEADYARAVGALPVINSLHQARLWAEASGGAPCHLMIDTGINRLGIGLEELGDPAIATLRVDVLMSHLASADEDTVSNAQQLERFQSALGRIEHRRASMANSAGIALGTGYAFDLTRPGLALYGGVPRKELREAVRQVAYVEAAILQIRSLKEGDRVGYNGEFTAPRAMRVATVSLGYADGYLRARGPGSVLKKGEAELPVLGKVSMDMIVVDCANAPECREGDWLSVPFSLPHAAQQSTVSQYELLTTLGQRLKL